MNIAQMKALLDTEFWNSLKALDEITSEEVREQGCPYCGDTLHRADYPRKPRGLNTSSQRERRKSFCCCECRKRTTPSSVYYQGRKVFAFAIVVLVSYLREDRDRVAMKVLSETFQVSEVTIRRWLKWWKEVVASSEFWATHRSYVVPGISPDLFLTSLWEKYTCESFLSPKQALIKLLQFLSPLSQEVIKNEVS